MRRTTVIFLVALVFAVLPGWASAQETTTTTGPEQTTTQPATTIEPAVVAEPTTTVERPADWTYRFLVPTGLLLAAVVVAVTVVLYFVQVVRKRYRMVR
jgi:phosphatidylglycerophosphate synthase